MHGCVLVTHCVVRVVECVRQPSGCRFTFVMQHHVQYQSRMHIPFLTYPVLPPLSLSGGRQQCVARPLSHRLRPAAAASHGICVRKPLRLPQRQHCKEGTRRAHWWCWWCWWCWVVGLLLLLWWCICACGSSCGTAERQSQPWLLYSLLG